MEAKYGLGRQGVSALIAIILIVILLAVQGLNQIKEKIKPVKTLNRVSLVSPPRLAKLNVMPVSEKKTPLQPKLSLPLKVAKQQATHTGFELLKNEQTPKLQGEIMIPFSSYLSEIQKKGGLLVVYDRQTNRLVGKIQQDHFDSQILVDDFARRARDVTSDVPSQSAKFYLKQVEQSKGKGAYRFLVMLPKKVEAHFIGLLSYALSQQGVNMATLDKVNFSYLKQDQHVLLHINKVEQQGHSQIVNSSVIW